MGLVLLLLSVRLWYAALWVCQFEDRARSRTGRCGQVVDLSMVCHAVEPPLSALWVIRIPQCLQCVAKKWVEGLRYL